jgi:hypothetical protein
MGTVGVQLRRRSENLKIRHTNTVGEKQCISIHCDIALVATSGVRVYAHVHVPACVRVCVCVLVCR